MVRTISATAAAALLGLAAASALAQQQGGQQQESQRQGSQQQRTQQQPENDGGQPTQQQAPQGQQFSPSSWRERGQQASQSSDQSQIGGYIIAYKHVGGARGAEPTGVILVRTPTNAQRVVDLGPVSRFDNSLIRPNQRMTAKGYTARVGDRLVFVATDVEIGGKRARIQRDQQASSSRNWQSSNQQNGARPEFFRMSGTILATKRMPVGAGADENVVALIQADDGQRRMVDLGSAKSLPTQLRHGQKVEVRGREVLVNDKVVTLAQDLHVNGQRFELNRMARGQGQQSAATGAGSGEGLGSQKQSQDWQQSQQNGQQFQRQGKQQNKQGQQGQQ